MLIYWLLFLIPVSIALGAGKNRKSNILLWVTIGFVFIFIIGFREWVGGDWSSYLKHYNFAIGTSLYENIKLGKDPAHQLINWLMARWDLGVYGTNVIYGTIFMIGLIKFSRQQVYPWIAMSVAVPYMVIVVAMGYSRQSVALGLFMWAITYLNDKKIKKYILMIFIAALFHKTAIILLPLGIFIYEKGNILRFLMIVPVAIGGWDLLLANSQENLWYHYVEREMHSTGAKIRVIMNLLPAILLLFYRKKWKREFNDYQFWFWISIASVIAMLLVQYATTAVDRISLYFIPIQLIVYARLPYLLRNQISPVFLRVMIILVYAAVLFIWLNYAKNAHSWLPYQNILFMDII